MRIVVLGAGHVGRALLDALHEDHQITVIDVDADTIGPMSVPRPSTLPVRSRVGEMEATTTSATRDCFSSMTPRSTACP